MKIILLLICLALVSCTKETTMTNALGKDKLAHIRHRTAETVRSWRKRHPGNAYRAALLTGSGALTKYPHGKLSARLFANYILSHDSNTNREVADETGQFLQKLWFDFGGYESINRLLIGNSIQLGILDVA